MSPRTADPSLRQALIDRAAAILAEEGQAKLTLRRLTRDVGVSTMAVYTHFGSMEQLRIEICDEGFRRLAAHLASVRRTKDPAADLRALGEAYVANARENPNLYRAMFFDPLPTPLPEVADDWTATFRVLVEAVQRWLEESRGAAGDAEEIATVLWAGEHGLVSLELSGLLQTPETDAGLAQLADSILVPHPTPTGSAAEGSARR